MTTQPLTGSHRRTAHELVRDTLRRAIVTGELPAGARLVQSDVAARLHVSITPVREAMRDLATEGLIQLRAHRGARVSELDRHDLREIYALRRILEAEALRRAALRITAEELAVVRSIQERMARERDPVEWSRSNTEFHEFVIATARSARLLTLVESLRASARPYVAPALQTVDQPLVEHNQQHLLLVKALEARDPEAAAQVAMQHLEVTLADYERIADANVV